MSVGAGWGESAGAVSAPPRSSSIYLMLYKSELVSLSGAIIDSGDRPVVYCGLLLVVVIGFTSARTGVFMP